MTVRKLVTLGSAQETEGYLRWLHRCIHAHRPCAAAHALLLAAQIGVQAVIDTLPGSAGSRQVRVGNLADHKVQLDVLVPWWSSWSP